MAKKKLFKSKTNFTLKRLHQSGSYGNIYERDYTTIANTGAAPEGQIPIYNSPSFKLSVRAGFNGKKKYNYGGWLTNPNNCNGDNAWTLGCMPVANTKDSKIILKPHTKRLTDFACYGSATELIRATLRDIIARFPAELYVTNKTYKGGYIVDNPMAIDILQGSIPEDSTFSPLRYFCHTYEVKVTDEEKTGNDGDAKATTETEGTDKKVSNIRYGYEDYGLSGWTVSSSKSKNCFNNGDLLATVTIPPFGSISCYYHEGDIIYTTTSSPGTYVRPIPERINEFFDSLDDFEKILLNQYTDYTARFETYLEDEETGWYMVERDYQWPIGNGTWNLAINGLAYADYVNNLTILASGYDALFTDAIWRLMSHDAISNMDLTFAYNGDDVDMPNSSKVKNALSIIGRQFDDLKKYADNVKTANSITYDQDSNTPDYFLSDHLELSGWESKEIYSDISDDIVTSPMYGARTVGFTAGDANNEFMRRLKLNSKKIFAQKGTKRALEDLMAVFGYHSVDWIKSYISLNGLSGHTDGTLIKDNMYKKAFLPIEYVYVADSYAFDKPAEEVVKEVQRLNQLKDSFSSEDINNDNVILDKYQGIPVVEVKIDEITRIVPWFDREVSYDGDPYFQMKGGWSRNDGDNEEGTPKIYEKTVSKIHYVENLNDLTDLTYSKLDEVGLYYVGKLKQYYKVKNRNKFNVIEEGWELASENDILEAENIIDNNLGNNPHSGDYDHGVSYLEPFGTIFTHATFSNAREEDVEDAFDYGFNITRQADSTKCLFFGENHSDPETSVALRGENRIKPYDLFAGEESYEEAASLSVINSKELHVIFAKEHQDFLEKNVLHYVKQIIPSTTIFSYSFEELGDDYDNAYVARTHQTICNGGICPIMGVV